MGTVNTPSPTNPRTADREVKRRTEVLGESHPFAPPRTGSPPTFPHRNPRPAYQVAERRYLSEGSIALLDPPSPHRTPTQPLRRTSTPAATAQVRYSHQAAELDQYSKNGKGQGL